MSRYKPSKDELAVIFEAVGQSSDALAEITERLAVPIADAIYNNAVAVKDVEGKLKRRAAGAIKTNGQRLDRIGETLSLAAGESLAGQAVMVNALADQFKGAGDGQADFIAAADAEAASSPRGSRTAGSSASGPDGINGTGDRQEPIGSRGNSSGLLGVAESGPVSGPMATYANDSPAPSQGARPAYLGSDFGPRPGMPDLRSGGGAEGSMSPSGDVDAVQLTALDGFRVPSPLSPNVDPATVFSLVCPKPPPAYALGWIKGVQIGPSSWRWLVFSQSDLEAAKAICGDSTGGVETDPEPPPPPPPPPPVDNFACAEAIVNRPGSPEACQCLCDPLSSSYNPELCTIHGCGTNPPPPPPPPDGPKCSDADAPAADFVCKHAPPPELSLWVRSATQIGPQCWKWTLCDLGSMPAAALFALHCSGVGVCDPDKPPPPPPPPPDKCCPAVKCPPPVVKFNPVVNVAAPNVTVKPPVVNVTVNVPPGPGNPPPPPPPPPGDPEPPGEPPPPEEPEEDEACLPGVGLDDPAYHFQKCYADIRAKQAAYYKLTGLEGDTPPDPRSWIPWHKDPPFKMPDVDLRLYLPNGGR